jgi:23S rRNA G2069 N7-methylase RlmK/C1962 C5-methylase RlmI
LNLSVQLLFCSTVDYRAIGEKKGYLKESTVRGWLKDDAVQMSIDSPQFFERFDKARESKRKQGRYHHSETRLVRKLRGDIDYQNGYTIKQIQFLGAFMAGSTQLSFGRTWARCFIRRFGVPSQTCKDRTVDK